MSEAALSRVSVVLPCYEMHGKGAEYLACALHSVFLQTWGNVEVVVSDNAQDGSISQVVDRWRHLLPIVHIRPGTHRSTDTLNAGIEVASGGVIRILFQDDLLFGPQSLGQMMQAFQRGGQWCVGRSMHLVDGQVVRPLTPFASKSLAYSINTIGPPSVLGFVNDHPLFFNEDLVWLMDCEYYLRLLNRYGPPACLGQFNAIIRTGGHQLTNSVSEEVKVREQEVLLDAYPELHRFRSLRTAWSKGWLAVYRMQARLPFSDSLAGARAGNAFVAACTGQPPR